MSWCVGFLVAALIIFARLSQGTLIVGPSRIRANQNYTLVVSNFRNSKLDLLLTMEGTGVDNRKRVLHLPKSVDVRPHLNRLVDFDIPRHLPRGSYKITIDGQRGLSYHEEINLVHLESSISALVQIDKPVFKPGDTVQFRVVVLDAELKPPGDVQTVHVTVRDPDGNVIRQWSAGRLHVGVFENRLEIAPTPLLGMWNISVKVDGEELVSKTFEVKEYVLSTFDVEVFPAKVPLQEHQGLDLTVRANYYFGKPVKGTAILELFVEVDALEYSKTWEVDGIGQAHIDFKEMFEIYEDKQDVRVVVTFVEQFTNRTVTKQQHITVYKYMYHVELVTDSPQFRPGLPFKCELRLSYHDGQPAKTVAAQVTVDGLEEDFDKSLISDRRGIIKQTFIPTESATTMKIRVTIDDNELLDKDIYRVETVTGAFVKIERKSLIQLNKFIKLNIICSERMKFIVFYVVSKGNILYSGFPKVNQATRYALQINATSDLLPKAKLIVATLAKQTIVYDVMDIEFHELRNNFKLTIDENEKKPGTTIQLTMTGRPGSYVALAAYDRSLLQHNRNHDLFWENIVEVFDGFHGINDNEFDKIHSMGLFARTLDNLQLEGANDKSARDGVESNYAPTNLVPYRTNFLESWLWQNITMNSTGRFRTIELVPDTTTSWYLTGFSVDPVYGLGIIKKPLQLTTVQPFYIVENLPYSVKREEAVVLQFTLFNNLDRGLKADVTLHNVANQIEFVGKPAGEPSYTKSITVPSKVSAPVAFLVKAKKLGEVTIRVKAITGFGHEADAIEKIIRVMPDSLVEKRMESRVFSHNSYANQSFPIVLDIDKKADAGSEKITFRVNPNLLTSVIENLENLIGVPTGSGEANMVHFVPNIIVLDYLTATASNDKPLINKVTGLLRQGYQNQMKYRKTDGSFGVWSHDGGSVFLTAFVAKSLQIASKYMSEVDITMVAKAFEWLASKQHSSGKFEEVGSIVQKDLQGGLRDGIALTSYVLIAFLENEKAKTTHVDVLNKGVKYLEDGMANVGDIYDRSIATYALMLSDHASKDSLMNKLIKVSTSINEGEKRYWSRDPHSVETTAYALLSLVRAARYAEGVPVMRWLVNQRYETGSFARTQDTFVGLKALTKLAEVISPSRNEYTIQLDSKTPKYKKIFIISRSESRTQNSVDIPGDVRSLVINVAGLGFGILDVKYEYTKDLKNYAHRFDLDVKKLTANSESVLRLQICTSYIPILADTYSNKALVEVNFPSGYVVDNNPISEATTLNAIKNVEIRFGATSVVIYYNNMGRERNCFHITAYRRFNVALKRPAYVLVHDYYDPKLNALQKYEVDSQDVCDVCAKEDCPQSCGL